MKHEYKKAELQLIALSEDDLIRMSGENDDPTETENGDVELPKVPLG